MEGTVNIQDFMAELKREGLCIAPVKLVNSRIKELELEKKQKAAWNKNALDFREIAEAELWGPIDADSVRAYAQAHTKRGEIFPANKGKLKRYKIIRAAVIRIAKKKGYAPDYLPELQS